MTAFGRPKSISASSAAPTVRPVLGQLGRLHHWLRGDRGQIVAVEGDVEDARADRLPLHLFDLFRHPLGDGHPSASDSDDDEVLGAAVFLEDLDGHAPDGAIHTRTVEQPFFNVHTDLAKRRF